MINIQTLSLRKILICMQDNNKISKVMKNSTITLSFNNEKRLNEKLKECL